MRALWEHVGCCCSLTDSTAGINIYIIRYSKKKRANKLDWKQFRTETFSGSFLPYPPPPSNKQLLCTTKIQEITICPTKHGPGPELCTVSLFVSLSVFFQSAAVSFLSVTPAPPVSESLPHRAGGGGRSRNRRESCLKCRPKQWWAFPWKQWSQQSVTSSVRGKAAGWGKGWGIGADRTESWLAWT